MIALRLSCLALLSVAAPAAALLPDPLFRSGFEDGTCGNMTVEDAEQCDDGDMENGDGCPTNCRFIQCGDGEIEPMFEECDTGPGGGDLVITPRGDIVYGGSAGDGCTDETCQIENGWSCAGEPSVCMTNCGDGIIAGTEQCDDGFNDPGDGCSASCAIENGWQCFGTPSVCQTVCGDGLVIGAEQCDDSNTMDNDGCSASCTVECEVEIEPNETPGTANGPFDPFFTICNASIGVVDDQDYFAITVPVTVDIELETRAGDGFSPCPPGADSAITLYRPDGVTVADSNDNAGTNDCALVDPTVNAGVRGLVPGTYYALVQHTTNGATIPAYSLRARFTARCQNGIQEGSEQCDDGDMDDTNGCNNRCRLPVPDVTGANYGVAAHGGRVVLTGTRFDGATSVTIGGAPQAFTVDSPTQITVSVDDTAPLGGRNLVVSNVNGPSGPFGLTVVHLTINELDADTPGTDAGEFVEISAGVAGVNLTGYTLTFWNGNGDVSYLSTNLAGTTDANGLLLVGNPTVVPAPALTFAPNVLQNGADAASIHQAAPHPTATPVTASGLIDALVYDTADADDAELLDTLLGAGPQRVQVDEGAGGLGGAAESASIQRCTSVRVDGRAFITSSTVTPGAVNGACP